MNTRVDGMVAVLALVVGTGAPAGVWAAEWCNPVPITELNSRPGNDNGPDVSSNERTIYFASSRVGGEGLGDIYASRRASRGDRWHPPVNVDAVVDADDGINTSSLEQGPALANGGHVLLFSSDRPGGVALPAPGGQGCGPVGAPVLDTSCDIWMAQRKDTKDDQGWREPVNVGPPVNSGWAEGMGDVFENQLYFSSARARSRGPVDAPGDHDIYVAEVHGHEGFGEPVLIEEVSSPAVDQRVTIASDGLVMLFQSTRGGGFGSSDLWMATRESTGVGESWSAPVNLGPPINTNLFEGGPRLSTDGKTLYFFRGTAADVDLFVSRRAGADGTCDE